MPLSPLFSSCEGIGPELAQSLLLLESRGHTLSLLSHLLFDDSSITGRSLDNKDVRFMLIITASVWCTKHHDTIT